ncbi:hypothetical protein BKI51_07265 [Alphaproteobacteria bacterium AO1-B]|nr:hypothetical protein BKI51_07265 [Alphaproteobacteria bacterium AO1-B]
MAKKPKGWTEGELKACITAYKQLLDAQLSGKPLSKAVVRREVRATALMDRTDSAYEFRMQNISAVMADIGEPIVTGYPPAKNVGANVKAELLKIIKQVWNRPALIEKRTADPVELETRVASALEDVRQAAGSTPPPKGNKDLERATSSASRFIRDPNVIAWVLAQAKGTCERCQTPAPFLRDNGEPFLEVHHVKPLAEGGPDTTDNAVALCPNCHRHLHHGKDRSKQTKNLISAIQRLNTY